MPRKSPYRILLTIDKKRQLQTITRKYTSPYCEVIRAKIVLLTADGLSNKEIGHNALICLDRSSPNGEKDSSTNAWPVFKSSRGGVDPALFPPEVIVAVKALACQLPKQLGLPFSRLSHDEIARQAEKQGIVATISGKTVWRWLSKDAIRPWCYRSWIWPRDPQFEQKAARVLDLYQGIWEEKPLSRYDFVICSDEKSSIQARRRILPVTASTAGCYGRVEQWSMNMKEWGLWLTWRPGMFSRPKSLVCVEPVPESAASRSWWILS